MTKSNPPAGNRGVNVSAGSGDTAMLPPRPILVVDGEPREDVAWLNDLLAAAS